CLFFLYTPPYPRHLHSFPTRRSSDLTVRLSPGPGVSPASRTTAAGDVMSALIVSGLPEWIVTPAPAPVAVIGPLTVMPWPAAVLDRKSTRLNSSHLVISYAVFCLKKK